MFVVLVLLFVVAPIAELYVILQVTHSIGIPETILLLIAISFVGAWLARVAGFSVLNRLQRTVRAGKVPSSELVDGALVLLAGALDDHARLPVGRRSRSCSCCHRRARWSGTSCSGASAPAAGSSAWARCTRGSPAPAHRATSTCGTSRAGRTRRIGPGLGR